MHISLESWPMPKQASMAIQRLFTGLVVLLMFFYIYAPRHLNRQRYRVAKQRFARLIVPQRPLFIIFFWFQFLASFLCLQYTCTINTNSFDPAQEEKPTHSKKKNAPLRTPAQNDTQRNEHWLLLLFLLLWCHVNDVDM